MTSQALFVGLTLTILSSAVIATPSSDASFRAVTDGCGVTTSCFVTPADCVATDTCVAAVSVLYEAGVYTFELMSVGGVWAAVGLSNDAMMGSDSVVECVHDDGTPADSVNIHMSYNVGRTNSRYTYVDNEVTLLEGSYINSVVYCKFTRKAVTTVQGIQFDLDTTPYHLLLAAGYLVTPTGLTHHEIANSPSSDSRLLAEIGWFTNV